MKNSGARLPEVEYLRALAIVLTLIAHATLITVEPSSALVWFNSHVGQFWGGVEIFFCVSGFVISRQLVPQIDRARVAGRTAIIDVLKSFYRRRAYRILPLAIIWATLTLLFSAFFNETGVFGDPARLYKNYLAAMLFVENFYLKYSLAVQYGHFWSLAIEEQFYLWFPFLSIIAVPSKRVRVVVALILVQALLPRPVDQTSWLAMVRYDALLMGVLVYFLQSEVRAYRREWSARLYSCIALCLIVLVVVIPVRASRIWFFTGLLDVCAALLVAIASRELGVFRFKRTWMERAVLWIGSRSYGIYMAHIPAMLLWKEFAYRFDIAIVPARLADLRTLVIIAAICGIAECAYRFVEHPLREYGRR